MALKTGSVQEQLFQLLQEDYGVEDPKPEQQLGELGLDSLDVTELGMKIEEIFGVTLPEDAKAWAPETSLMNDTPPGGITLGGLVELIEQRMPKPAA